MPTLLPSRPAAPAMNTRAYVASTVAECLLRAREELGPDAMILGKRTFRKGAWFGRWGGQLMFEVTFGLENPSPPAAPRPSWEQPRPSREQPKTGARPQPSGGVDTAHLEKLETEIAGLTASVQGLVEANKKSAFTAAAVEARGTAEAPPRARPSYLPSPKHGRGAGGDGQDEEAYPALLRQLLDSEVAAPLARQLLADLPPGLSAGEAASQLRTRIAQRLLLAGGVEVLPPARMRLLAFVGTTGVGKTTTIAKLAARFAVVERRRVGIVTLDTFRVAAAQQLQTYGDILRVPVKVAHDKHELSQYLAAFEAEKTELVLIDTAGRSPHDMIPLGETAHLFEGAGDLQKILAVPATLGVRDMENVVARFQSLLAPDALILTKLDEATDNTCFGRLLTVQAKYGVPLAYVTTGQKVPDDLAFPDAHAIAARILSTAVL